MYVVPLLSTSSFLVPPQASPCQSDVEATLTPLAGVMGAGLLCFGAVICSPTIMSMRMIAVRTVNSMSFRLDRFGLDSVVRMGRVDPRPFLPSHKDHASLAG